MKTKIVSVIIAMLIAITPMGYAQAETLSMPQNTTLNIMKVVTIDVGQGDSLYIKMASGEDILIDAGDSSHGDEVVAELKKQNVDDLEAIVLTHGDSDHCGGMPEVFTAFNVESVYAPKFTNDTNAYEDFILAVQNEGLKIKAVVAGVTIPMGSGVATFVGPIKDYNEINESSAILKISYLNSKFLFTGDAPISSLMDSYNSGQDLSANFLKVSHHGSSTGTSSALINVVKPTFAVVSVAKENKYGHPHQSVLELLKNVGIKTLLTSEVGTIECTSDGNSITMNGETIKSSTSTINISKTLKASVDNAKPKQNSTINLLVTWKKVGVPYTAVFKYKSTKTIYKGVTGTPIPVRIGRSSKGFKVKIEVTMKDGNTYKASTFFTAR